jgi:hypothetical protein
MSPSSEELLSEGKVCRTEGGRLKLNPAPDLKLA